MYIAVLACSNGMGHTRRVISIASFILRNGFAGRIDAYLPVAHLKRLNGWSDFLYFKNHPAVRIFDFEYPTVTSGACSSLNHKDWNSITLPNLDPYDVVWSDNILQVLTSRPDSLLTGSFLWHEVFEHRERTERLDAFISDQKEILGAFKPKMAGNEYFATNAVRNETTFYPVGLYKYAINYKQKTRKCILLSCGLGGEEESVARESVRKVIDCDAAPPDVLFVEKRLLPSDYPSWILKADFSDQMFHDCIAVCIRPGLGTLSDALVNHSRVFAFSNEDSYEMLHNCNVLEWLGVGEKCLDPFDAYQKAIDYLNDVQRLSLQFLKTSHLRTDGVFATANFILQNNFNIIDPLAVPRIRGLGMSLLM